MHTPKSLHRHCHKKEIFSKSSKSKSETFSILQDPKINKLWLTNWFIKASASVSYRPSLDKSETVLKFGYDQSFSGTVSILFGGGGCFRELETLCKRSRGPPTSQNGLMHEPSQIPIQKHLTLPPPSPRQKNKRKWN